MKKRIFIYVLGALLVILLSLSVLLDFNKDSKSKKEKIVLADTTLTSRIYMT